MRTCTLLCLGVRRNVIDEVERRIPLCRFCRQLHSKSVRYFTSHLLLIKLIQPYTAEVRFRLNIPILHIGSQLAHLPQGAHDSRLYLGLGQKAL